MASSIKIKRSDTGGNPSVLGAGELAYSGLTDNGSNGGDRLYIGMGTETAGNAVNHVIIGGKYFTDMITAATNVNTVSTLVKRDASGNFTANVITAAILGNASTASTWASGRTLSLSGDITYTSPSFDGSGNVTAAATLATVNANVGTWNNVTVNGKGLVTGGSNTAYLTANQTITHTGDVTGTGNTSFALTLATVNATPGVYGSATAIPIVTVNAKGLVTSVTTAAISSTLSIAGGTGTDAVSIGTDTLTFAGGTGVATTVTNNQVSFAIGQAVATTSNVTFNDVTVSGKLYSNDITATSVNVDGDAVITGNLTVNGTTTTINATNLSVTDLNITVAKDAVTAVAANGAGLTVNGPTVPATLLYSSADDRWNLNKALTVATVYGALSGNATTATTWQTARNLSLSGDGTATLTAVDGSANVSAALTLATVNANVGTWNNVTVNGKGLVTAGSNTAYLTANQTISVTGDATGSGTTSFALTLATVNSNVGSFGTSTSVPSFTVNAKGLITAASTTAIPTATTTVLGLASFATAEFNVTAGAVTVKMVDGGTY
jgi:hypothetical protein